LRERATISERGRSAASAPRAIADQRTCVSSAHKQAGRNPPRTSAAAANHRPHARTE